MVYNDQWNGAINETVGRKVLEFLDERLAEYGIPDSLVKNKYKYALRGFAAKFYEEQLKTIQEDSRVDFIEQDRQFRAIESNLNSVSIRPAGRTMATNHQVTPWGITRVNGPP